MAHRHNRRRIRPRHRHFTAETPSVVNGLSGRPQSQIDSPNPPPLSRSIGGRTTSSLPRIRSYGKSMDLAAQHWQNRYVAWQKRDRAQRDEATKLEADQFRLFGGEPGDDETLCYRMLEYFGGLDYIDT